MMIEHCMSMVTDIESDITEASQERVGAVKDIDIETARTATARVMQENALAAEDALSIARETAAGAFCNNAW